MVFLPPGMLRMIPLGCSSCSRISRLGSLARLSSQSALSTSRMLNSSPTTRASSQPPLLSPRVLYRPSTPGLSTSTSCLQAAPSEGSKPPEGSVAEEGAAAQEAREQKERILTVPNLLCVSRIVAAPYIAHCIINGSYPTAAALFVYAGATDMLDGWVARNFKGQASSLGSFLDPLSDKILVGTVFLALTYAGHIPASLTGLIVSRDLFLVYAGLYIRYMSVVPPFSLQKYFDPTLPTATIQPTTISKINTALQFLLIAVSLGAPLLQYQGHPSLHYLWAATGLTTFLSAVSYAFMKDTYRFSHREYDHQFGKKLFAFILFLLINIGFTLSFPSQVSTATTSNADCPITGGPDPYSAATNAYYLKQIRSKTREE